LRQRDGIPQLSGKPVRQFRPDADNKDRQSICARDVRRRRGAL
jgi:hypothetical protein